jgi:hypothetical protein
VADLRPRITDRYRVPGWAFALATAIYGATLYCSTFSRGTGRARYGRFRPKTQKINLRGAHRWPVANVHGRQVSVEIPSGFYNTWIVNALLRSNRRAALIFLIQGAGAGGPGPEGLGVDGILTSPKGRWGRSASHET